MLICLRASVTVCLCCLLFVLQFFGKVEDERQKRAFAADGVGAVILTQLGSVIWYAFNKCFRLILISHSPSHFYARAVQ